MTSRRAAAPDDGWNPSATADTGDERVVEAGLFALLEDNAEFVAPINRPADDAAARVAPPARPARPSRPSGGAGSPRRSTVRARSESSPFWRFGFPALVLALAFVAVALVRVGLDDVLQSRGGQLVDRPRDPTAPGYEVLTEPTPTLLVVQTDSSGAVTGSTLMALSGEKVGGVIVMPPGTAITIPGMPPIRFDVAFKEKGLPGIKLSAELSLQVGIGDVVVVDPTKWAELVQPVGTVELTNPEEVRVEDKVLFRTGPLALKPADVSSYLSAVGQGESDVNRLNRNRLFWDAWLAKVKTTGTADALPGESNSGIGKFVRGMSALEADVAALPGEPQGQASGSLFTISEVGLGPIVSRMVPFPVSPAPGFRLRVRVLDGTGRFSQGKSLAPTLVQAGCEITAIGNAKTFDIATTELIFHDDARREKVDKIAATLGVGRVQKSDAAGQGVDLTIILGADAEQLMQDAGSTVITSPPEVVGTTILGGPSG